MFTYFHATSTLKMSGIRGHKLLWLKKQLIFMYLEVCSTWRDADNSIVPHITVVPISRPQRPPLFPNLQVHGETVDVGAIHVVPEVELTCRAGVSEHGAQ